MKKRVRFLVEIVICMVLALVPANAQSEKLPPLLPKIFIVSGLTGDDRLNIREQARATAPILGTLEQGAKVEVTATSEDRKWVRILHQEGDGWVSMRYLQLDSGAVNDGIPPALACFGTEPFWSLDIAATGDAGGMSFDSMEGTALQWSGADISTPANRGFRSFAVVSDDAVALVGRGACSDDMSERTYGWKLDLILRGQEPSHLQGCCTMVVD